VKAININREGICNRFPQISEEKIEEGTLVGPHVRQRLKTGTVLRLRRNQSEWDVLDFWAHKTRQIGTANDSNLQNDEAQYGTEEDG
jgi:hypothetical protein